MEEQKSRNYFIDKSFQNKFIIKFASIVVISSLVIGSVLFFLLKHFTLVSTQNIHSVAPMNPSTFLLPVIMETVSIIIALTGFSIIFITIFTWHKIDGPLFRFNKELAKLKEGNLKVNFTTRKHDQLKELSVSLTDMSAVLIGKHSELKKKVAELKDCLQAAGGNKEAALKKADELEEVLNYFKV